jgi:hypothetical protein
MAPQAQPRPAKSPQITPLTQQDRHDNDEAVVGSAEDGLAERGETQSPRQNQNRDDVNDNDAGLVRRETIARSPQDDKRNQIAARFRRAEPEDERPFNGDMSDPENLYGVYGGDNPEAALDDDEYDRQSESVAQTRRAPKPTTLAEPGDTDGDDEIDPNLINDQRQPQQDHGQQPRMITRTVRGKKVTLSEEEWLVRATQVTAADSYLEESRNILKQAEEIRAGRAAPTGQHPDRQTGTQDDGYPLDAPDLEVQQPEPTFKDAVQRLQYGDPDEAAELLERLVDSRATKKATEGQLQRSYDQDLARSQKALKAFSDANPELAADEIAAMAIERGMYQLYKQDMLALGLDEAQLPKTPKELANWHRFYRINGYEVSSTTDLLNRSKDNFVKWRSGSQAPSNQQRQPSRRQEPRVQVNVDRDQRRMAIPVQPQRAVAPRRDVQETRQQTGSDVVAAMRRQRGQT